MKSYLARLSKFVFRGFAIRTDVWYALISMAVSALAGSGDKPVTEVTTHDVAWYFLIAMGVYLTLRILAAPYYLWKEDQAEIARLVAEVDRPDKREADAALEHRIALRAELGGCLAKLIAIAEASRSPEALQAAYGHRLHEIGETEARIGEIVSMLSYDMPLRVTALNLRALCWRILKGVAEGENVEPLVERLWAQRKLTFRIINRDDEVADFMTMVEVENLISEHGETFESSKPASPDVERAQSSLSELKELVKKAGPNLHLIGRQPNFSSTNRFQTLNKKDGGKFTPR